MAKVIDESLKKQLSKKMVHFLKYFPVRIKNVGEDAVAARNLIWAFKDSRDDAYEKVAQMTADHLQEEFGEQVTNMVFVCVPASTQEQNQSRYARFCERVSELTGIANGFTHVKELSARLAIDFDAEYFNGKNVLVMDDVVTTGTSYALFANQLETFGANVLGGFFLGRTSYKYK